MDRSGALAGAVSQLKVLLKSADGKDQELKNLVDARDEVIARYQPIFGPDNLDNLTEDDFRQFLIFKNNRHWASLQRMGPTICQDMPRLRNALKILLDEQRPLRERLNELVPKKGPAYVPRLAKAVLTPILLIVHPDRYGVWNQISDGALKRLNIWPAINMRMPFGERYEKINEVLLEVSKSVGADLWTLDALWWRVVDVVEEGGNPEDEEGGEALPPGDDQKASFGLERHLQDFLRDNWSRTSLGKDWKLYEEDGDPDAGYEYPCDVGRIDLLAKHRSEPKWLVIELKRKSSDQTVGQLLRYMGWVKHNMASAGEVVEGMVIAHQTADQTAYAASAVPGVGLQTYEVEFRLKQVEMPRKKQEK